MVVEFFPKGVKYLTSAVTEDEANHQEEALRLYLLAFEYLMAGLKYSKNDKVNQVIRAKLKEFIPRAEHIKEQLTSKEKKQAEKDAKESKTDTKLDPETEKLRGSLSDAILKEKPNVSWDDVAGLQAAKSSLEEALILPQRFPQMFTGKRKPWKGILLYGPPGTGKTLLAKAAASMTNSTFFSISSSDLLSKWLGESEKLIRELFRMAQENKPSIIFIDELDAICGNRSNDDSDSGRRIKTEFLVQMNKILDSDGVFVLGATNRPFDLDPAVRRRFEKRIYIPLPDEEARVALLKVHLGKEKTLVGEHFFADLSKNLEGFSGADIAILIRDALMSPIREAMKATHWKKIINPSKAEGAPQYVYTPCSPKDPNAEPKSLMDFKDASEILLPDLSEVDFVKAMSKAKPSVSKEDLEMQERFTKLYGTMGTLQPDQPQVPLIGNTQPQATNNNNNAQQTPKQTKTDQGGSGGQKVPNTLEFPATPNTNPEEENITPAELELMKHTTEITDKVEKQKQERKDNKKKKASVA